MSGFGAEELTPSRAVAVLNRFRHRGTAGWLLMERSGLVLVVDGEYPVLTVVEAAVVARGYLEAEEMGKGDRHA